MGKARSGDRRKLHRPGGRRVAAKPAARRLCGRTGAHPEGSDHGREIGTLVRAVHEEHGVRFHLPDKVQSISKRQVQLE